MTQTLSLLPWTRLSALAAVGITAAAVSLACSSSSSSAPANPGDASPEAEGAAPQDAATPPSMPCDASIVLPAHGSAGGACGDCLAAQCADSLSTCQTEGCTCVSTIECLAAHDNNYPMCPDALALTAANSSGLTALEKCIVDSCTVCNGAPD